MARPGLTLLAAALVVGACSGSAVEGTTAAPRSVTCPPTTSAQSTPAPPPPTGAQTTPVPAPPPPTITFLATTTTIAASPAGGDLEPRRLGIGDDYYPDLGNPGYDVEHYTLDLDFDPVEDHLSATATITAIATARLDTFNLDFDRLTIDALRVDGDPAEFVASAEEVTVSPSAAIPAGEDFVVEIDYSGMPGPEPTPAVPLSIGWFNTASNQSYVVAAPDGAHTWFPSNDHPLDKATFTIRVTVPEGVTAAANGDLVSTTTDAGGSVTWVWEMREPMAPYLATVVIGEFDIVVDEAAGLDAGIPIRHVLPRGTTVADWPGLERQGEMLAFLSELFGPYPFGTYGIAVVDELPTALENQTLSVFGVDFTASRLFEIVLVHELAHQWFGNSVSVARWGDIWLNEGFASYAEWLWFERELGDQVVATSIERERRRFSEAGGLPPGAPLSDDLFASPVYRVGAMTLHALRLTVGDETFFEILRAYHDRFRGGTATTHDFIAVAEALSGRELDTLFDEWLYGEETPEFPAASGSAC